MVGVLEAAGEATRLRLLALLAEAELTVSELMVILGQSQPRVSRHLRLLMEAGLAQRHREGAWAFFRLRDDGPAATLAKTLQAHLDTLDPVIVADRRRLADARRQRSELASAYFARHAATFDEIRALHVEEAQVEAAVQAAMGRQPFGTLLDIGTGTGRMLELFAPQAMVALGVDQSPAMLALARARLAGAPFKHVQLRQGDVYALPVEAGSQDVVIIHQVLHYLDEPAQALREAARALAPGGRMLVVDFAPHEVESLRADHAHRRLGFERDEISAALRDAGLEVRHVKALTATPGDDRKLTVLIFVAHDRRGRSPETVASAKEGL
ncbi:MAG: metalloregulator ArsR/SmtB family transcription factor [Hyphomicrobiales bacterium]|nr:metalloregulator ArsR/SmtB family transcription factor [Hyphomicrobiales bacterium]